MLPKQTESDLVYARSFFEKSEADYHDAIVDAARDGATQREIAAVLGISYSTVRRIVKDAGAVYVRRAVI